MAISYVLVNILSKISFTSNTRLNFTSVVCFIAHPNKSANFCTISALCLPMHLIMLTHVRYVSYGPQHTLTPYPPPFLPFRPTVYCYCRLSMQGRGAGATLPCNLHRSSERLCPGFIIMLCSVFLSYPMLDWLALHLKVGSRIK